MHNDPMDAVNRRVMVLERRLRFQTTAGFVGLLVLASAALVALQAAQAQVAAPKTIRAERFELVDSKGRTTLDIASAEDGTPRLALVGPDGQARIALMLDAVGSPILLMKDAAGRHQLTLDVREALGPTVSLRDTERDSGIILGVDGKGVVALGVMGEHARSQIELGVNPDGSVRLALHDKDGNVVFLAPESAKKAQ